MKAGICSAHTDNTALPKDLTYIGADRGVEKLLAQGITPAFAIGDFDSLTDRLSLEAVSKTQILPERKDVTDTQAALEWAIGRGYDDITIFGATGGRLDHFMAVLVLLELHREVKITVKDSQNEITLLKEGIHIIEKDGYKYFSLFAPDRALVSISGAQYNLSDYLLLRSDPLCCSNQVKETCAQITTDADLLLIKSSDHAVRL